MVGNAAGWPSPMLVKMKNHETPVFLTSDQISWMVSLMYLGHLLSPFPSGYLMDKVGRKQACLMLSILPLFSWVLIWSTVSVTGLYLARFVAGLWAGVTSTIVPVYIGEIAEPHLRSSLNVFNHLMRNFGVLFVYTFGPYVSYLTLALSCCGLTTLYILLFVFVPETPYFLVMANQKKDALNSLNWLRGDRNMTQIEEELNKITYAVKVQTQIKGSFKDIWLKKGNRKALIISEVYSVSKRLSGSGVLQAYISLTLPPLTFGIFTPNDCVIILGIVSLLSSGASVILSIYFKRRTLISFSSAGCAITMALVGIWFYLNSSTNLNITPFSDWLFVCFVVYNATFSVGLGPIGASVKGELFPANLKAICSSLTTVFVAVTSFILNKLFLNIADILGMQLNFFIYSTSCVFIILFTYYYMPDTQGKSLDEIQSLLQGFDDNKTKSHITNENRTDKSC